MTAKNVNCVVAIYPNYWGVGATVEEADKAAKRAGYAGPGRGMKKGDKIGVLYLLDCAPTDVTVEADVWCRVTWPKEATAMRLTLHKK